jgi:hypothetical protein
MSDDKLIKEATETPEWEAISLIDRPLFVRGYITGAKAKLSELDVAKHLLNEVVRNYWDEEEMYSLQIDIKEFLNGE